MPASSIAVPFVAWPHICLLLCSPLSFYFYVWILPFLCSTPQHLKYFTSFFPLSYHLISTLPLTPHCITWLTNTSSLFLGIGFPFSSPTLFLQLQTRCLNFLQLKYFSPFFLSSSALSLVRAHHWLSILLIKELYCLRDMVLYSSMSNKIDLTSYYYICWGTRSSSNQTPTAILTTALIK